MHLFRVHLFHRWRMLLFHMAALALLAAATASGFAQPPPYLVCIDPGHSRVTVGASGRRSAEYRVVWQVALKLKRALEQRGIQVLLTKQSADADLSNEDRAETANRARANLFLRLHCDAGPKTGTATYYPDRQGVKNGVRGPGATVIAASRKCAYRFHSAMIAALRGALKDQGVRTDRQTYIGGRQGGALTGSIYSHVPVLLVEMCVITNPRDEAFIASRQGQERMAQALAAGVQAVCAAEP